MLSEERAGNTAKLPYSGLFKDFIVWKIQLYFRYDPGMKPETSTLAVAYANC